MNRWCFQVSLHSGWPGLVSKGNDGPSGVSSKDSRFPSYPNAGSSPIYLGKEMTLWIVWIMEEEIVSNPPWASSRRADPWAGKNVVSIQPPWAAAHVQGGWMSRFSMNCIPEDVECWFLMRPTFHLQSISMVSFTLSSRPWTAVFNSKGRMKETSSKDSPNFLLLMSCSFGFLLFMVACNQRKKATIKETLSMTLHN